MLPAVGDEDTSSRTIDTGVALGLVGDRLAQLGEPGRRRVVVEARLAARGDRGVDDVCGRREVGFAGAEADDVLTGGPQRFGLGVDCQRRRFLDVGDPPRDPFHAFHGGTQPGLAPAPFRVDGDNHRSADATA